MNQINGYYYYNDNITDNAATDARTQSQTDTDTATLNILILLLVLCTYKFKKIQSHDNNNKRIVKLNNIIIGPICIYV